MSQATQQVGKVLALHLEFEILLQSKHQEVDSSQTAYLPPFLGSYHKTNRLLRHLVDEIQTMQGPIPQLLQLLSDGLVHVRA